MILGNFGYQSHGAVRGCPRLSPSSCLGSGGAVPMEGVIGAGSSLCLGSNLGIRPDHKRLSCCQ